MKFSQNSGYSTGKSLYKDTQMISYITEFGARGQHQHSKSKQSYENF